MKHIQFCIKKKHFQEIALACFVPFMGGKVNGSHFTDVKSSQIYREGINRGGCRVRRALQAVLSFGRVLSPLELRAFFSLGGSV